MAANEREPVQPKDPRRRTDSAARAATFVLMIVAFLSCEVAAYPDGRPRAFGLITGAVTVGIALGLDRLANRRRQSHTPPGRRWSLLILGLFLAPFLLEPWLRELAQQGFPLELQLVNGLRHVGLLLCGLALWPRARRLAGLVALFLALFTSAMGDQPAIPYLLGLWAIVGGVWMVCNYRAETVGQAATLQDIEWNHLGFRWPVRETLVFGLIAAAGLGLVVAGPNRVYLKLGEWMSTSGGTGETDPFARYGIGDGPEETSGPNAKTAGMVESDQLIEDNRDALIDAVNDTYGPPHKPKQDQERMVSAGQAKVIENHGRLPENRRPNRDFDTARNGPNTNRKPTESRAARGLFEIQGRTPLHIRVVAYEQYDESAQRWREGRKPGNRGLEEQPRDWMQLYLLRDRDWYGPDESHTIKVAGLQENLVPTPSLLWRVRIDKVNRADYYDWDYEGVLVLAGRKRTPPGVIVHTESHTVNPADLPEAAFQNHNPGLQQIPVGYEAQLAAIAQAWAGDQPRGWPQIQAILTRLRTDYTADEQAHAPKDHPQSILWFLNESRRGPDYLFASSAALLLRSLGYSTRVCLGFYASPAAYDEETDHTPVRATDLHTWPEITLGDGHWLVLEPTPGYETLAPRVPLWQQIWNGLVQLMAGVAQNPWPWLLGLGLLGAGWFWRIPLADALGTQWLKWRWFRRSPSPKWREACLSTLAWLETRARWAGAGRRVGQPWGDWVQQHARQQPEQAASLLALIQLAQWAAYGPPGESPSIIPGEKPGENPPPRGPATEPESHSMTRICQHALATWSRSRFRPSGESPP